MQRIRCVGSGCALWDPRDVSTRTDDPETPARAHIGSDPLEPRDDGSLPSRREEAPAWSHESLSALFGSCERTGRWSSPDRITANSWFGEVKLDFRDAEIAADGVVEVEANAVFGQVTLRVPRGTEVELDGCRAIFGEVGTSTVKAKRAALSLGWLGGTPDDDDEDDYDGEDDEPMLLRVTGTAIFGGVTVRVG